MDNTCACGEARKLLAWNAIDEEAIDFKLDETQRRQLAENTDKARRDLRDAELPLTNILNRLASEGEAEKGISVRLLLKNWPVKAARDAMYASPQFPRIIHGTEAIQDASLKGGAQGELAYVGKSSSGNYASFVFKESLSAADIEVVDEMWTGDMPPQKWMNFYTKVLAKFAFGSDLNLKVSVIAQPADGVTKQRLEETKCALRELGLNDDVQNEH